MSTDNNNPQTAVDGDGTTDLVPNEDPTATVDDENAIGVCLRIKTVHLDCGGILDLEQNKVDEDVLCGKLTALPALVLRPLPSNLVDSTTEGFVA